MMPEDSIHHAERIGITVNFDGEACDLPSDKCKKHIYHDLFTQRQLGAWVALRERYHE